MFLIHLIKAKHISSAQTALCEGAVEHFGWMEVNSEIHPRIVPISTAFFSLCLAQELLHSCKLCGTLEP